MLTVEGKGHVYLGKIRGYDGYFSQGVEEVIQPAWEKGTTGLRQVQPGDASELERQALEKNGEQVAKENNE